jgi:excisionase family DNA binding protein
MRADRAFTPSPDSMGPGALLTVDEACDMLRVSRWSFYRLVQTKQLRTFKLGSRRLVQRGDVQRLIAQLLLDEGLSR